MSLLLFGAPRAESPDAVIAACRAIDSEVQVKVERCSGARKLRWFALLADKERSPGPLLDGLTRFFGSLVAAIDYDTVPTVAVVVFETRFGKVRIGQYDQWSAADGVASASSPAIGRALEAGLPAAVEECFGVAEREGLADFEQILFSKEDRA